MKIYAIRHGQTDYNLNRLVQGWTDHPLNQNGIDQAALMGRFLKKQMISFTKIISSPLIRSTDTARIIQKWMGLELPIEIDNSFIERNFGVFEGDDVDITSKTISAPNFKRDGYEHDEALLQRIELGLNQLYERYPNDVILLSCHSHVIKSLLILADPKTYTFRTFLNNGSLCTFEYDGKKLLVREYNIEPNDKP